MDCAQINITGGGSGAPATVSFPGAYAGSDPVRACDDLLHECMMLIVWVLTGHHNWDLLPRVDFVSVLSCFCSWSRVNRKANYGRLA